MKHLFPYPYLCSLLNSHTSPIVCKRSSCMGGASHKGSHQNAVLPHSKMEQSVGECAGNLKALKWMCIIGEVFRDLQMPFRIYSYIFCGFLCRTSASNFWLGVQFELSWRVSFIVSTHILHPWIPARARTKGCPVPTFPLWITKALEELSTQLNISATPGYFCTWESIGERQIKRKNSARAHVSIHACKWGA